MPRNQTADYGNLAHGKEFYMKAFHAWIVVDLICSLGPKRLSENRKLKMKNEKLKIKNGICALRAIWSTAGGGRAKTPPEAVKQLSAGHSFSFSFFIFRFSFLLYFFVPYSRTAY